MRENFVIIDKETGKPYWISRALAVATVLISVNIFEPKKSKILLQKRGPKCPDNIGKWCFSCGYLNWGETLKEAASRELWEETGIRVKKSDIIPWKLIDDPKRDARENVVQRFIAKISDEPRGNIDTASRGGEEEEVSELKWISIEDIEKMDSSEFAFNHKEVIQELINEGRL
jgi:8-oxo-dGTP diphosphatase